MVLTYLRVLGTECDIPNKGAECWPPLVQKLGLKAAAPPSCIRGGGDQIPRPSAVSYPVETSLFPTPASGVTQNRPMRVT